MPIETFMIAGVAAILMAVGLYFMANQKGEVHGRKLTGSQQNEFLPSLLQAIGKLPVSPRQQVETAEAVAKIFDQEVAKKLDTVAEDLANRYKKIINEKEQIVHVIEKQSQAINEKYKTVQRDFKKLGTEKKQTEAIIRSMGEGLIVVNKKGETVLMNPAAEKLLGVKKEEKIGKPILKDLREDQLVSLTEEAGEGENKDIVLQSVNDQTKKVLRASNAVIESENGQTIGMVSILTDVTKQREIDQLKSDFIASVSHELRTPITVIRQSLSLLLEKTEKGNEDEHVLTIAVRNTERLSRLINDLLDLSKMEARKLEFRPSRFLMNELIQHVVTTMQSWAKSKDIQMDVRFSASLDVEADQDRIEQVLTNLMQNALKFTPKGGKITLEAKKIKDASSAASFVQVCVADTGPGISQEDIGKLFQKFIQLKNVKEVGGTGLGLAISKEIIQSHGGRIWAESEVRKGSRFIFEIPENSVLPA